MDIGEDTSAAGFGRKRGTRAEGRIKEGVFLAKAVEEGGTFGFEIAGEDGTAEAVEEGDPRREVGEKRQESEAKITAPSEPVFGGAFGFFGEAADDGVSDIAKVVGSVDLVVDVVKAVGSGVEAEIGGIEIQADSEAEGDLPAPSDHLAPAREAFRPRREAA